MIAFRHGFALDAGDFYVVAVHAVKSHFQRGNPGLFPFALFKRVQERPRIPAQLPQLVQFVVETVRDHAAVPDSCRRCFQQRASQECH